MQDWLNRGGLFFQFVAFYLVTTQVIGEENLKKYSNAIYDLLGDAKDAVLHSIPLIVFESVGTVWLLTNLIGYAIYDVRPSAFEGWPSAIDPFVKHPTANPMSHNFWINEVRAMLLTGLIVVSLAVGAVVVALVLIVLVRLGKLIAGSTRGISLVGAVLFTIGFVILFTATFLSPAPPAKT